MSFGSSSLIIGDESSILYSDILDVQGGSLATVECSKEQPSLPCKTQGRGFPCWSGTASFYVLIAGKSASGPVELSVFSFKNERVFREFLLNAFAVRYYAPS